MSDALAGLNGRATPADGVHNRRAGGMNPTMEGFIAFAIGFGLLQAATYLWNERSHRQAWVHDVPYARSEPDLESGFRGDGRVQDQTYVGPLQHPRAPWGVRATALWSIGMGQMLIPGGAMALVGCMFYGVGLVGIPGCILAARIWAVGPALLRAEPGSVHRARSAARFARVLNTIILVVVAAVLTVPEFMILALGTALYAGISFAHARALDRAADRVEALWVKRGYSRDELSSLTPRPHATSPRRRSRSGTTAAAPAAPPNV
ncbi:MAG: hypothetical protein ACRBN8_43555 [Nannocystales bacterium]